MCMAWTMAAKFQRVNRDSRENIKLLIYESWFEIVGDSRVTSLYIPTYELVRWKY